MFSSLRKTRLSLMGMNAPSAASLALQIYYSEQKKEKKIRKEK